MVVEGVLGNCNSNVFAHGHSRWLLTPLPPPVARQAPRRLVASASRATLAARCASLRCVAAAGQRAFDTPHTIAAEAVFTGALFTNVPTYANAQGAVDFSKLAIVGHSCGGGTAALAASRHPEFAAAVALDPW